MARFLIKKFSRINFKDIAGRTALSFAVQNRNMAMIKMLLCYKADPSSINTQGKSILALFKENMNFSTDMEIELVMRTTLKHLKL